MMDIELLQCYLVRWGQKAEPREVSSNYTKLGNSSP
jgi:hypothetical protein